MERRKGDSNLFSLLEPKEAKRGRARGLGAYDRRLSGKETAGGGRGSDGVGGDLRGFREIIEQLSCNQLLGEIGASCRNVPKL